MSDRLLAVVALVAVAGALALAALESRRPRPAWREPAEALELARREGRPVLVVVGASWCAPCWQLERTTLRDPRVVAELASRWVAVHLDADVSPDAPWARGVSSYPTLIALDPGGAELARLRGVQPAAELVAWLRAACAAAAASRGD